MYWIALIMSSLHSPSFLLCRRPWHYTINHSLRLDKLDDFDVRGVPHSRCPSYLPGSSQYFCLSGQISSKLCTSCGVPQGTIFGPLLFLLYINDKVKSSKILRYISFDESTLCICQTIHTHTRINCQKSCNTSQIG